MSHLDAIISEQALLGAVLVGGDRVVSRALELGLTPADFGDAIHAAIWDVVSSNYAAGAGYDHRLISAAVGKAQLPNDMTVQGYLGVLAREASAVSAIAGHAVEIVEAAGRRRAAVIGNTLMSLATGPIKEDPRAIAAEAMAALDELATPRGLGGSFVSASVGAAADAALAELDDLRAGRRSAAISTGLRQLDAVTGGGWRPGQLAVLAGRPGMGKTAVGVGFAVAAALNGAGVLMISLEMAAGEIAERILSSFVFSDGKGDPVPYASLRRPGRLSLEQVDRLRAAKQRLQHLPLQIDAPSQATVARVRERAMAAARRFDAEGKALRLIAVDHLGLLRSARNFNNRVNEVSELTAGLKALARELSVPIIVLSQLSRQAEQRDDKRPQLSDLRDSGSIEQDSDIVLGLFRPSYYLDRLTRRTPGEDAELVASQSLLELEVLKNRAGPTDRIRAYCSIANNFIADGGTF